MLSQPDPPFVYRLGIYSAALGKRCAVCAAPFQVGDRIALTVGAARPALADAVHTACLLPLPPPRNTRPREKGDASQSLHKE